MTTCTEAYTDFATNNIEYVSHDYNMKGLSFLLIPDLLESNSILSSLSTSTEYTKNTAELLTINSNDEDWYFNKTSFEFIQKLNSVYIQELLYQIPVSNFFYELGRLYTNNPIDDVLDYIFNTIDDELIRENFVFCDKILSNVDVVNFSKVILLAISTVTFPYKDNLTQRTCFIEKIKKHFLSKLPKDEAIVIINYL